MSERIELIPGDDMPANGMDEEVFLVQLRGELALAMGRLSSLVEVLE